MNSSIKYLLTLSLLLIAQPVQYLSAMEPKPETRFQKIFYSKECPICLEGLTDNDTVMTTCRHLFHQHCIEDVLQINNRCPLCQNDFSDQQSQVFNDQQRIMQQPVIEPAQQQVQQVQQVQNQNNQVRPQQQIQIQQQPQRRYHKLKTTSNNRNNNPQQMQQQPQQQAALVINNGNQNNQRQQQYPKGVTHANINDIDQNGWTKLSFAIYQHQQDRIQQLILCGAKVNITRPGGYTPLFDAVCCGMERIVQLLIDAGANVNADVQGSTALIAASEQRASRDRTDIAQALINAGAATTINSMDRKSGFTALMRAAQSGNFALVQLLLANGADIESVVLDDLQGQRVSRETPLIYAVQEGREDVVRILIKAGANVHAIGRDGQSVLSLAQTRVCDSNSKQPWRVNIVKLLQEAGAI